MELTRNPNITLRQLWHFVAAAETGTMSEAARRLHMAPSAISMSIAELEKVVGAQLCVKRKSKGITLTPAGQAAFAQARQILDMAGEMVYISHSDRASIRGPLTVGCFSPVSPSIIPRMLDAFEQQCPQVEVTFDEGFHVDVQKRVLDGSLDLGIVYAHDVAPGLEVVSLYSIQPYAILSEGSPLATLERVTPAALSEREIVLFDAEPLGRRVLDIFQDEGVTPRLRHRSRSYATVRALVGRDMGVSIAFDQGRLKYTYEGLRVIKRPLETARDWSLDIAIVRSRSIRLNSRARAWIETATELFGDGAEHDDLGPAVPVEG